MKLSLQQKEQFFHELAEYVKSGRSIPEALKLKSEMRPGALQRVAARMLSGAPGGDAAAYFQAVPEVFSVMDREIVTAGERSGLPERAFGFLREYYESLFRARNRLIARLLYPVGVLHLGAVLLAVPTLFTGNMVDFVRQVVVFLGVFYVLGFLAWLVVRAAVRAAKVSAGVDGFVQSLPAVGGTRIAFVGSRFCAAMGMFVQSGSGILGSMDRSAEASGSARFRRGADQAIAEVKGGGSLGEAVVRTGAFPEAIDRAFQVAESSGKLDEEMNRLAGRYSEQFRERAELAAKTVGIVVYGCVLAVFSVKILQFWMNYYGMAASLLN